MKKEFKIKKCTKCGAIVKVIEDCKCEECKIQCCGEQMKELIPNSVDAAIEKHVPTYEVKDGMLYIKVNHVMEDEHFIEWITVVAENEEKTSYFAPGEEATVTYKYQPGTTIYAYCNKHGLWKVDVK